MTVGERTQGKTFNAAVILNLYYQKGDTVNSNAYYEFRIMKIHADHSMEKGHLDQCYVGNEDGARKYGERACESLKGSHSSDATIKVEPVKMETIGPRTFNQIIALQQTDAHHVLMISILAGELAKRVVRERLEINPDFQAIIDDIIATVDNQAAQAESQAAIGGVVAAGKC